MTKALTQAIAYAFDHIDTLTPEESILLFRPFVEEMKMIAERPLNRKVEHDCFDDFS